MYGSNIFSIKAVFQSHCTESANWKFPLISLCYVSDSIEIFGNEDNAEITVSKLRVNQFRRFRVSLDVTNVRPGQLNSIETDWSIGVSIQVSTSRFRMLSIGEWIAVRLPRNKSSHRQYTRNHRKILHQRFNRKVLWYVTPSLQILRNQTTSFRNRDLPLVYASRYETARTHKYFSRTESTDKFWQI